LYGGPGVHPGACHPDYNLEVLHDLGAGRADTRVSKKIVRVAPKIGLMLLLPSAHQSALFSGEHLGSFLAGSVPDPDPSDPHVFRPFGPLIRGMDPDPDPSTIKQK
jgi:hypothetical protein